MDEVKNFRGYPPEIHFLEVDFVVNEMLLRHRSNVCVQHPSNKGQPRHCVPGTVLVVSIRKSLVKYK